MNVLDDLMSGNMAANQFLHFSPVATRSTAIKNIHGPKQHFYLRLQYKK